MPAPCLADRGVLMCGWEDNYTAVAAVLPWTAAAITQEMLKCFRFSPGLWLQPKAQEILGCFKPKTLTQHYAALHTALS